MEPKGMTCQHCGEPIEGITVTPGMHNECAVRLIAGSVAHQQGRCSCYGGTDEDDPALTKREAARAAFLYAAAHQPFRRPWKEEVQ